MKPSSDTCSSARTTPRASARRRRSLKAGALQSAIFNSANFSSIATDAKGVIQIFNVGAERMLGYAAADVVNKITPARHLRSAGGHRPRRGAERRARHPDRAGLRGAGLQGLARDRGHLRADVHPQGREPVSRGRVRHGAARRARAPSSATCSSAPTTPRASRSRRSARSSISGSATSTSTRARSSNRTSTP